MRSSRCGLQAQAPGDGVGGGDPFVIGRALLAPFFRLNAADHLDVRPAYHPEPHVPVRVDPADGPVMVAVEYDAAAVDRDAFASAARLLRQVRRRDGAMHWALFEDVERPGIHLESYLVSSWTEHKRQGDRQTATDQQMLDEIWALQRAGTKPGERYLLGRHHRSLPADGPTRNHNAV